MNKKKPLKILVVDDELLIRRSLQMAGEKRGHIIQTASNGAIALSLWPSFEPDVAFIDVLMPNMSGFELLKKIPKNSQTKNIIISAHDEMNEEDIKHSGAKLFIQKPFEDIFSLIKQAEKLGE